MKISLNLLSLLMASGKLCSCGTKLTLTKSICQSSVVVPAPSSVLGLMPTILRSQASNNFKLTFFSRHKCTFPVFKQLSVFIFLRLKALMTLIKIKNSLRVFMWELHRLGSSCCALGRFGLEVLSVCGSP